MKTPNVIVFPDYMHSSCSFWRAVMPFNELARQNLINVSYSEDKNQTWTSLTAYDIAVFQRPLTKEDLTQIAYAKDCKCKIVVDIDDYVNDIPETHPIYDNWKRNYDEVTFIKIMMLADVVTVTNEYLRNHYSMYHKNVVIIPNAINDRWFPFIPFKETKTVFLRAGDHHEHDIYEYKDEIIEVMNSNPDWTLEVAGHSPTFLAQEIKNYKYVGDFGIRDYFAYILQSKASIFIAPLLDNKLNRGKSNIVWQEAALSGAISLIPEWMNKDTFSVYYNDKDSFKSGLQFMINNKDQRFDYHKNSVSIIKEKYILSKANETRLKILNNLL